MWRSYHGPLGIMRQHVGGMNILIPHSTCETHRCGRYRKKSAEARPKYSNEANVDCEAPVAIIASDESLKNQGLLVKGNAAG